MVPKAKVSIDSERVLGNVDPRIYGQFIENAARVIYGGVFEPGSRLADEQGFRRDVLEAAADLSPTVIRWPGGNFASGYHWRDGVGPPDERPARHDPSWGHLETNTFGTQEFLALCRRLGAQPYITLNASTGSFDETQGWVEYCNGIHPIPEVKLRQAGPHPEPHNVTLWGIGNENYGWWQVMHTTADRYAEVAREWGKLIRGDGKNETVAVGNASSPDWNWTVLSETGPTIDFLSLHFYWHGDPADRYHAMLAGPIASERVIEGTWGMVLEAQRKLGLPRPVRLCVDEWNAWEKTFAPLLNPPISLEYVMRRGEGGQQNSVFLRSLESRRWRGVESVSDRTLYPRGGALGLRR